jgi:ADP-ribose pyrophosphatase
LWYNTLRRLRRCLIEIWLNKQTVYNGRIFSVQSGQAALSNGGVAQRDMVTHDGGVAVVPLLGSSVLLIRQFRIVVGQMMLELPAGRREGDEDPVRRAALELEEEIGYRAGELSLLSTYYSSAGFTNERMHIYLAADLTPVPPRPEPDEEIEVVPLSLSEVGRMLDAGAFEDAKTIIGLRELLARPTLWGKGGA